MKKIDEKKVYTAYEILKDKLITGADTYSKLLRVILNDLSTRGPLKAIKVARGKGTQWKIKGSNIIKYLTSNDEKNSNNS